MIYSTLATLLGQRNDFCQPSTILGLWSQSHGEITGTLHGSAASF